MITLARFKKPKAISGISKDMAQIFFGVMFIGPIVSGQPKLSFVISGLALSLMSWYINLSLEKE